MTVGGVSNTHSVQYAYGTSGIAAGKLTSMTYPPGNRVNYTYDSAGKLSEIILNPVAANGVGTDLEATIVLVKEITYAPFGNVKGWSWGNSSETAVNGYARTYDLDGRVTSYNLGNALTTGTLRTVAYDAGSRIISYTHTGASTTPVPSSLNQTFGYDVTDRLKSNGSATTNRSYSYDDSGNRTNFGIGSSNYANTISATSNRLMATAGPLPAKTNSFDAAGNLLSDGTVTYTYNPRNRMRSSTVAGVTVTQLDNGLGQRVQRSGSPGIFVYDENGQLVGEYSGATGAKVRETVYLGDLPIAVLKPVSAGNEPTPTVATEVYYVFPDHLGTPRVITAASDGAIVWRWDQGDASGLTPPNENPVGRGMFTFNLRMPGQYHDRENNLFYNYFRDYDPQTGRYVQSDPIGLEGGINTYAYVEGNPLSYIDPEGLQRRGGPPQGQVRYPPLGATSPVGSTRSPMTVNGSNFSGSIRTQNFSGHAFDRMQGRGLPPSVILNAIRTGTKTPGGSPNTTRHYDAVNNVTVVTNSITGNVITVRNGPPSDYICP